MPRGEGAGDAGIGVNAFGGVAHVVRVAGTVVGAVDVRGERLEPPGDQRHGVDRRRWCEAVDSRLARLLAPPGKGGRILVKDGQRVEQGDPIAEIGATGRVTGAHLDWRMNWFEQRIDPQLLAGPMPATTETLAERR